MFSDEDSSDEVLASEDSVGGCFGEEDDKLPAVVDVVGCEGVIGDLGDVVGASSATLDCFGGDDTAVVEVSCCEDLVGVFRAIDDTVSAGLVCSGLGSGAFVATASSLFAHLIDGSDFGSGFGLGSGVFTAAGS